MENMSERDSGVHGRQVALLKLQSETKTNMCWGWLYLCASFILLGNLTSMKHWFLGCFQLVSVGIAQYIYFRLAIHHSFCEHLQVANKHELNPLFIVWKLSSVFPEIGFLPCCCLGCFITLVH